MPSQRDKNLGVGFFSNYIGDVGKSIGDVTSRLNMGVSDITNVAGNLTSNLSDMQNKVQGSLQEGLQSGLGGLETLSKAGIGGVQQGLGGLGSMSKSIMDSLNEQTQALTNTEALRAKGNHQLVDTITTIQYQILAIFLYIVLAVCIKWYLIEGVERTMSLVKNSQQFLDDPDFEKKLMEMRDHIGSDIYKYSDLNQLKQGMDGLRSGIMHTVQDSIDSATHMVKDGASMVTGNLLHTETGEAAGGA